MSTDIFIRTYAKDARWLEYCLRSVEKYARKFRQTVVVYGSNDESVIGPICRAHPGLITKHDVPSGNGYADQLTSKISCDLYTDADFFFHVDDDCVFTGETTPLTHTTDGKPDVWYDRYDSKWLRDHHGVQVRKPATEAALGRPNIDVETTRRFPVLYPRWLYKAARDRIESVHGVSTKEYIFHNCGPFSEFNVLGALAYYEYPKNFALWSMDDYCKKPPLMKQFWSHSGLTPAEEVELKQITDGYRA
jgi:hypothetical protein